MVQMKALLLRCSLVLTVFLSYANNLNVAFRSKTSIIILLSALQSPSVNSRILMVCFTFLIYTYECFIRLKFETETDIYLCSKDSTVVYAKGPLRNSAALVTSRV